MSGKCIRTGDIPRIKLEQRLKMTNLQAAIIAVGLILAAAVWGQFQRYSFGSSESLPYVVDRLTGDARYVQGGKFIHVDR
jgi:hypothetical protein